MNVLYHAMRRAGSIPAHPRLPIGTANASGTLYQTGNLAPARHESPRAGLARVGYQVSISYLQTKTRKLRENGWETRDFCGNARANVGKALDRGRKHQKSANPLVCKGKKTCDAQDTQGPEEVFEKKSAKENFSEKTGGDRSGCQHLKSCCITHVQAPDPLTFLRP